MPASSLHLLFLVVDQVEAASTAAADAVWKRWIDKGRFERKVIEFEKAGLVRRSRKEGNSERLIAFTQTGRALALGGKDPATMWERPWDGSWRQAAFDVPVSENNLRAQLRRKLRSLGFGYLQQSVWITPDPVDQITAVLAGERIDTKRLTLFESKPAAGESDADLVQGAWDFEKINAAYRNHASVLDSFPSHQGKAARQAWFRAEFKAWAVAADLDPFLPKALLPSDYIGRTAFAHRRETLQRLIHTY